MAPLEYLDGQWAEGTDSSDPDAAVSFGSAVSWLWWARGDMGQCATMEDAKREAETALRRMGP